jgi:hypothetical protein
MIIELPYRLGGKKRLRGGPERRDQVSYFGLLLVQIPGEPIGAGAPLGRLFPLPAGFYLGPLPSARRRGLSRFPDELVVLQVRRSAMAWAWCRSSAIWARCRKSAPSRPLSKLATHPLSGS